MIDREKVMEALDCLANGGGIYDCLRFPCPYGFYGYTDCHKMGNCKRCFGTAERAGNDCQVHFLYVLSI